MARSPYAIGSRAAAYFSATHQQIDFDNPALAKDAACQNWLDDSNTLLASNLTSLNMDVSSEFADATTRETALSGFASNVSVLKNGQLTFDVVWQPADATGAPSSPYDFTSLLFKTWIDQSFLSMAFLDWQVPGKAVAPPSPPAGKTIVPAGMFAYWSVGMSIAQDLRDVQRASVTLSVSGYAHWYKTDTAITG